MPRSTNKPAGNSSAATNASRVIHDVRGLKNTCKARKGRPISSQTHSRPKPTRARPAKTGQLNAQGWEPAGDAARKALLISNPEPAPPQIKLPAARQSQLVCCHG